MQTREERQERFVNFNTLNGVVKALENHQTIIDLRNESCVSGLITNVDYKMNVEMSDVVFYDPRGIPHKFEIFYINNRNIRYVHIPEGLSPQALLDSVITGMRSRPDKNDPKPRTTFKKKRAQRYQEEILRENFMQRPGPSKP